MLGFALTNVGMTRENNEDNCAFTCFHLDSKDESCGYALGIVCDGMGGAAAGEVASEIGIETITREVMTDVIRHAHPDDPIDDTTAMLKRVVSKANTAIYAKASANKEMEGMGCTCSMALLRRGIVYVANVGDSRTYLWRNKELIQQSEDHSFVHELVKEGVITPEEALVHPRRNEITRVLGVWEKVDTDVFPHPAVEGDVYLSCSDGLWEMVADGRISTVFSLPSPPEDPQARLKFWAEVLINEANNNGGEDNISAVLLQIEASDVVDGVEKLFTESPKPEPEAVVEEKPKAVIDLTKTVSYSQREEDK